MIAERSSNDPPVDLISLVRHYSYNLPGNNPESNPDERGNERAGIDLLDDGSAVVGIDDQPGRERTHLYFILTRGAGLLLQDGDETEAISLLIAANGKQPAGAKLEMKDKTGKSIFTIPVPK